MCISVSRVACKQKCCILICSEGEATCPAPEVANSVSSLGEVSVYQVGDVVTVSCIQGFQLDGAEQIICGSSGQWQPQLPQCLPLPQPSPTTRLPVKPSELVSEFIKSKQYKVCL